MRRGYDIGAEPDDVELAVRTAAAFLPTTHQVIERSRLVKLTDTARAAGRAEAACDFWPDVRRAYLDGRARGIEVAIRFRVSRLIVAVAALAGVVVGYLAAGF